MISADSPGASNPFRYGRVRIAVFDAGDGATDGSAEAQGTPASVLMGLVKGEARWGLPGGAVEAGETMLQAAWRELEEETSLRDTHVELVGSAEGHLDVGSRQTVFTFRVRDRDTTLSAIDPSNDVDDEFSELRFFTEEALQELAGDAASSGADDSGAEGDDGGAVYPDALRVARGCLASLAAGGKGKLTDGLAAAAAATAVAESETQPPADPEMSEEDIAYYEHVAATVGDALCVVPDYPKPGVNFKDVTSIMEHPAVFQMAIDAFVRRYQGLGVTHVIAPETRGLMLGAPLALALKCAFVPVRKPRKLPRETAGIDFRRHFMSDRLEIHHDSVEAGSRAIIIDDIVSTGMTIEATARLVEGLGAMVVELACIAELPELHGRQRLAKRRRLFTLVPDDSDEDDEEDEEDAEDDEPAAGGASGTS